MNIRHGGSASRTELVPKAAMVRRQDALDGEDPPKPREKWTISVLPSGPPSAVV
jgi:hypothetical protein